MSIRDIRWEELNNNYEPWDNIHQFHSDEYYIEQLDKMDISIIEKYLRKKKLENINKK